MLLALVISYIATLLYLCTVERFRRYALIITIQGWLLLVISFVLLDDISLEGRFFIITETLILKGLLIPYLMYKIIGRIQITMTHRSSLEPVLTTILGLSLLGVSMWIGSILTNGDSQNYILLVVSIFSLLVGLLLITTHKRIFSHLVGFFIIENSVFLFSLTIGSHLPLLLNLGVLLDVLLGLFMLIIFLTKLKSNPMYLTVDNMSQLRD